MNAKLLRNSTTARRWDLVGDARAALAEQSAALADAAERLDERFERAVDLLLSCSGRVIVCGLGKSGHVARKLAATFASTGTPSLFLHASEAGHGDLGMVTTSDLVVLVSNSGETEEIRRLLPYLRELGIPLVGLLGNSSASLARSVDVVLDVAVRREACPLNLAPTTSSLVQLAVGDALAMAVMRARKFDPGDFARFHPGGALGRRLLTHVRDEMIRDRLPFVAPEAAMSECLIRMTEGRCGLAIVVDAGGALLGVVTDGDLRRGLQKDPALVARPVTDFMTKTPITICETATLEEANALMNDRRIKAVLAVDASGRVTGVLELFAP